jgi:glycosyltransferase involved in cell wall biosynthesis
MAQTEIRTLVSVIIPIYNRELLLSRSIGSVFNQTYDNWHLILVDDGSTDNSLAVCKEYHEKYPKKITVLHQQNTGAGGARNLGIVHSKSKYIAFLDSDDSWRPTFLEIMVDAIENCQEVDWVYCNLRRLVSEKEVLVPSAFDHITSIIFRSLKTKQFNNLYIISDESLLFISITSSIKCGANSLVRRTVFEKAMYNTAMKVGEDRLLNIELISKGVTYGYVNDILLDVYSHGENISCADNQTKDYLKIQGTIRELLDVYEYVKKNISLSKKEQLGLNHRLASLNFSLGKIMIRDKQLFGKGFFHLLKGIYMHSKQKSHWKSLIYSLGYRCGIFVRRNA